MNRTWIVTALVFSAGLMALVGKAEAAPIGVQFGTFGTLSGATFGGIGIPNNAVAITTVTVGSDTITLGLEAFQRFVGPSLANDGAGTFTALAGVGSTASPCPASGCSDWNIGLYINVSGPDTLSAYQFNFLYDFNPGLNTDSSQLGSINLNNALTLAGFPLSTSHTYQDSENMAFAFLSTNVAGAVVAPLFEPFNPNAIGQYSFALSVTSLPGIPLGESAIEVNTVQEPASMLLFGTGVLAVGAKFRKRRSSKKSA